MTNKYVVNPLTHCTTLLENKSGKETIYKNYTLFYCLISINNASQHGGVPNHLNTKNRREENEKYLPSEERRCLSSAPEMQPWPSLSKVLNASMQSANVPCSKVFMIVSWIGKNSSNLYDFSPKKKKQCCKYRVKGSCVIIVVP